MSCFLFLPFLIRSVRFHDTSRDIGACPHPETVPGLAGQQGCSLFYGAAGITTVYLPWPCEIEMDLGQKMYTFLLTLVGWLHTPLPADVGPGTGPTEVCRNPLPGLAWELGIPCSCSCSCSCRLPTLRILILTQAHVSSPSKLPVTHAHRHGMTHVTASNVGT